MFETVEIAVGKHGKTEERIPVSRCVKEGLRRTVGMGALYPVGGTWDSCLREYIELPTAYFAAHIPLYKHDAERAAEHRLEVLLRQREQEAVGQESGADVIGVAILEVARIVFGLNYPEQVVEAEILPHLTEADGWPILAAAKGRATWPDPVVMREPKTEAPAT